LADANSRKAVFVDRDCTIIEDTVFSVDPADLKPLPGTIEALQRLQRAGYLLVVVTNQSGVARGRFSEEQLQAFHDHMVDAFAGMGVRIAGVYYCPHFPGEKVAQYARECDCRKPQPGMLLRAAREHHVDLAKSWMIGDRPADVGVGKAAGCRTVRVLTGQPPEAHHPEADFTVPGMTEAADSILQHHAH